MVSFFPDFLFQFSSLIKSLSGPLIVTHSNSINEIKAVNLYSLLNKKLLTKIQIDVTLISANQLFDNTKELINFLNNNGLLIFFFRDQGGEMLYARSVGLALRT